jgi:hypothetical protein
VRSLAPSEELRQEALPTTRIETRRLRDIERPYEQERERRPQGSNAANVRVYEQRVDETPNVPAPVVNPEPRSRREFNSPGNTRVRESRSEAPAPQAAPATPNTVEQRPATVNRAWRDTARREANEQRAQPAPRGAEPRATREPLPQPPPAPNPTPEATEQEDDGGDNRARRRGRANPGE